MYGRAKCSKLNFELPSTRVQLAVCSLYGLVVNFDNTMSKQKCCILNPPINKETWDSTAN